ncbi:LamG-like jellyroll fold domain-containing protein [Haloferax namakaokahaiae]|uniref:LamG-like jellyroll fold domain-containing protein n=1 Tax=Haloferax namakaokahaiae TaxID=1748331 RepID=A0ABD5ZC45_9EURY
MPKTFDGTDVAGASTADGVTGDSVGDHDGTIQHQYNHANPYLSSDILTYLPLNDNSLSTATDISGNGNDGTYNGTPTLNDWQFLSDGYAGFDGSDDYVRVPGVLDTIPSGGWTISAWFYVVDSGVRNDIVSKTQNSALDDYFILRTSGGEYEFFMTINDTGRTITGGSVDTGLTHIIAGQEPNGNFFLDIDGTNIGVNTNFSQLIASGSNSDLVIGLWEDLDLYLEGGIGEVVVYNRSLIPTERQNIYDVGSQANLVTGWK